MGTSVYLKEVLRRYQTSFDLYHNYSIGNEKYPAYGYFFSLGEKYVLSKEANLWSVRAYEHILFVETDRLSMEQLHHLKDVMAEHMEPELVRKGQKYPEKDHMISYLTIIVISKQTPDDAVLKGVRKFHYDKGYLFNFRGHCEGDFLCACLDTEKVYHNYGAKRLKEMYCDVFTYLKKSKTSLTAAC